MWYNYSVIGFSIRRTVLCGMNPAQALAGNHCQATVEEKEYKGETEP